MRYLKIAFGLVMVAGLMAVAASPAMALGPRWVTCAKVSTGGQWSSGTCTTSGTGWETKAISETVEVTSSGKLELEDSAATGGKVIIECSGTNLGTVGAEGQGNIISITATSCEFVSKEHGSCEEGQKRTAEAINLPWSVKLEERENTESKKIELRDLVRSLTTKSPGWKVTCRVDGILEISDECTGGTSTAVNSNRATGATEFVFDSVSAQEPASCTAGNNTSGSVRGTVTGKLRNSKGELLSLWVLASVLKT